jgi:polar amino acid transport system substrate-binding protein
MHGLMILRRKKMKKIIMWISVLTIALMAMAGCSGEAKNSRVKVIQIPLTQEEYAFGVDKSQPDLYDEVNTFIEQIQNDGTYDAIYNNYFGDGEPVAVNSAKLDSNKEQLVVATNAGFEPFEYTKGDSYYGIDMEIAALLAEHLGKELVISNMDFDAVCLSVGEGKADIAMAGLTINEERREYVNFTVPYYNAAQTLISMEDDDTFDETTTADDVAVILNSLSSDTKIGVQQGTTGQFYVEGDADWGFDGYDVNVVTYKSGTLAVQDMINGNIQYVIIDEAPAGYIVESINELN